VSAAAPAEPLVIAVFDDAVTCDPHTAFDSPSRQVALNVYEGLVRPGEDGRIEPALAARWSEEPAGTGATRYRFHLRPGVRFHDDSPLEADDVVYSLRRALLASAQVGGIWLDALADQGGWVPRDAAEACRRFAVGGGGVEVVVRSSFPALLSVLGTWGLVVPRRWAAARGEWDGRLETAARAAADGAGDGLAGVTNGTGPYRLHEWSTAERRLVFRRHAGYWGPAPQVDEVRLVSEDDRMAREGLLLDSKADFSVCQPESLPRIEANASITIGEVAEDWHLNPLGFLTQRLDPAAPAVGSGRFGPDGLEPRALSDPGLRRALAASFDYERFQSEALGSRVNRHFGPFPRPSLPDGPEPPFAFDPEAAERWLAGACEGRLARDGCRLLAYTHRANVARTLAARVLADGFNALRPNCRMEVVELPLGELTTMLYHGRCPVAWIGWDADYPHPHALASQLLDPRAVLPRALGIDSAALTALWADLRAAENAGQRLDVYRRMAGVAIDEVLHLYLPSKIGYLVHDRRWRGVRLRSGVSNVLDFASFAHT
jgi:peptide/nickel transport system substrate-binding protein